MSNSKKSAQKSNAQALFVTGIGIGALTGLSTSPVLHLLLGAVLALVGGVVSALVGITTGDIDSEPLEKMDAQKSNANKTSTLRVATISVLPLALFVCGILTGAIGGVFARTHEWLSDDPSAIVTRWERAGLERKEAARLVFGRVYGGDVAKTEEKTTDDKKKTDDTKKLDEQKQGSASGNSANSSLAGVLYSSQISDVCKEMHAAKTEQELRNVMAGSLDKAANKFADNCKDFSSLKQARELLCGTSNR